MKTKELVEMIRVIVAEEVRKQLPNVVSEMYLKRLIEDSGPKYKVEKQVTAQPKKSFSEIFEDEINSLRNEETPEPLDNEDDGIYQQSSVIHKESVRDRLTSPDNPFAAMYEGVVPNEQKAQSPKGIDPNVFGDPKQYGKFFKKMNEVAGPKGPMAQTDDAKMRELELRRRQLDEIKVDVKG